MHKKYVEMAERMIREISYLSDRYDPLYEGEERKVVPEEIIKERAVRMCRNDKIHIWGNHSRPMQSFAENVCGGKLNASGRSVTVDVQKMIERFPSVRYAYRVPGGDIYVRFEDVYRECMVVQIWEKKKVKKNKKRRKIL